MLDLMGAAKQFALTSCDADGVTYGIVTTDVEDPARVEEVLTALAEASRRSIGSQAPAATPMSLPGVTPYRGNVRMKLVGRRADGETVEEAIALFARGTRVYQATAIGRTLPPSAVAPFLDGLHFAHAPGAFLAPTMRTIVATAGVLPHRTDIVR